MRTPTTDQRLPTGRADACPCDTTSDLISLAEKGRAGVAGEEEPVGVGVVVSSSSASSSGSTTSGDDDLLTHRTLRHRDPRAYRQMSPNRSPYDGTYHQVRQRLSTAVISMGLSWCYRYYSYHCHCFRDYHYCHFIIIIVVNSTNISIMVIIINIFVDLIILCSSS